MKIKIGVMGSASGPTIANPHAIEMSTQLGAAIAKAGCILINGACPGLPDHAAAGARAAGGFVLGVSPAFSEREHLEIYRSPVTHYDIILFTGLGLMERDIINIRSADAIIVVGGGIGTLNEFTVAFEERKVIGILTGTGGISDHIPAIVEMADRKLRPATMLLDSAPEALVQAVLRSVAENPHPMHLFEGAGQFESPNESPVRGQAVYEGRWREEKVEHDRTEASKKDTP